MLDIRYELTTQKKEKPDETKLGFGKYYTDHMFVVDHTGTTRALYLISRSRWILLQWSFIMAWSPLRA